MLRLDAAGELIWMMPQGWHGREGTVRLGRRHLVILYICDVHLRDISTDEEDMYIVAAFNASLFVFTTM
jgi:hypothetical protein